MYDNAVWWVVALFPHGRVFEPHDGYDDATLEKAIQRKFSCLITLIVTENVASVLVQVEPANSVVTGTLKCIWQFDVSCAFLIRNCCVVLRGS